MARPCTIDGCDRPRVARGYCTGHYTRWRKGQPVDGPLSTSFHGYTRCAVDGCLKAATVDVVCKVHAANPDAPNRRANARTTCSFAGCDQLTAALGLCISHWSQQARGEVVRELKRYQPCKAEGCERQARGNDLCGPHRRHRPKQACAFDGCELAEYAKGYCPGHYAQHRRGRELTELTYARSAEARAKRQARPCSVDGCEADHYRRGYCREHYNAEVRGHTKRRTPAERGCDFEGCDRPHSARGYCAGHYAQLVRGNGLHEIGSRLPVPRREATKADPIARPRRTKAPKADSKLPPGWFGPARGPRAKPSAPVAEDVTADRLGPTITNPPWMDGAALATLRRHDALDLADMLGLPAA